MRSLSRSSTKDYPMGRSSRRAPPARWAARLWRLVAAQRRPIPQPTHSTMEVQLKTEGPDAMLNGGTIVTSFLEVLHFGIGRMHLTERPITTGVARTLNVAPKHSTGRKPPMRPPPCNTVANLRGGRRSVELVVLIRMS